MNFGVCVCVYLQEYTSIKYKYLVIKACKAVFSSPLCQDLESIRLLFLSALMMPQRCYSTYGANDKYFEVAVLEFLEILKPCWI